MENPLVFGGAVLMGFGVLELLFGPVIARLMPPGTLRVFLLTGLGTLLIGALMFFMSI